ncbi:hypothetical protein OAK15_03840 [Verrucomicrobia bacterium]|nr:hypothetical protein [Verrucomicrobiota bacterium]
MPPTPLVQIKTGSKRKSTVAKSSIGIESSLWMTTRKFLLRKRSRPSRLTVLRQEKCTFLLMKSKFMTSDFRKHGGKIAEELKAEGK